VADATSISLSKLTAAVQAAVKAAVQKHPKFNKIETPAQLAVSYLIRGIPVPEAIVANVTLRETQAFASDVASHLAGSVPEGFAAERAQAPEAAVFAHGTHVIIGIPAIRDLLLEK
jgi:DNA primase